MMIQTKYKSYPAYKKSGVEWIGEIPEGWEVRKVRWSTTVKNSNVDKKTEKEEKSVFLCNYVDVYKNEFIDDSIDFMEASATDEEIRKFILKQNDVIITKDSEEWTDIAIPAYITKNFSNVICGYHLALLRPKPDKLYGKYLFRCLQSKPINTQFMVSANGITRFGLGLNSISSANLILPPIPEQQAIADFLDRETARINGIVEKQTRMIELLKEKRSALITKAVTKGLDPNVKRKPSGVEWFGGIPKGWEVLPLKRIADITYGIGGEIDKTLTEGINLLSLPNIQINGEFDFSEKFYTAAAETSIMLKRGDLLFNWRNGSSDHLGKTALFNSDEKYTHVSFLLRIRFKTREFYSPFYFRFVNGLRENAFFSSSKAGVNNTFNQAELKRLLVVIPPLPEQKAIADFLDRETAKIDTLIEKIERQIKLLSEYRQSLITSAVTGKIDVSTALNISVRGEANAQNS